MTARAFVERVAGTDLREAVSRALRWLDWERIAPDGARVFLKPNLTWAEHLPGVTTSPAFIEAAVDALRAHTPHITIGESDGGYHAFEAEEAFRGHGLYDLADRFGVEVVNLSRLPSEEATTTVASVPVAIRLPSMLLHEVDVFVTLPVPKIHAMTGVSLGFKNQWGCLPTTMRLRNHPDFARTVLAINKLVRSRVALFDGTYFLDRSGPMIGEPIRMDLLIAADDVGAGTLICCYLMGLDPGRIRHLRMAQREGMMPSRLNEIALNRDLAPLLTHRFTLERTPINWIALAAFRSRAGTRLLYDSGASDPLHRILYTIRGNPTIGRLLYGPAGPPASEGRRGPAPGARGPGG